MRFLFVLYAFLFVPFVATASFCSAGTLPETEGRHQTSERAEQHRVTHVEWRGGGPEPVVELADDE